MSNIFRVRNTPGGEWTEIPAIVGPKGEKGDKGTTWYLGNDNPNINPDPKATPRVDDVFLDQTTGNIYKYNGTVWVLGGCLKGEKGDRGPQGDTGADYVITEADYSAIADVVLTKLPDADEVSY